MGLSHVMFAFSTLFAPGTTNQANPLKFISLSRIHTPLALRANTNFPLRGGLDSKEEVTGKEAKIAEIEAAIRKVEDQINIKENEIADCNAKEASALNQQEKEHYRGKEKQLRDEKSQLRDEKSQLRAKEILLLDEKARLGVNRTQIQVEPVPERNLWSDGTLRNAARKAFEVPYRDPLGVVHRLIEVVQQCRRSWQTCKDPYEKLYAPYIAVVQASMMGKTRMFFTLPRHNIYVFYICLRADGSYPSGIVEVIKALTSDSCTEGYYAAFVLAALQALHDFKSRQDGSMSKCNSYTQWLKLQQNLSFWKPILGEEVSEFHFVTYT